MNVKVVLSKISFEALEVNTESRVNLVDLTYDIEQKVHESGARKGIYMVYLSYSTATVAVNENENDLLQDTLKEVKVYSQVTLTGFI